MTWSAKGRPMNDIPATPASPEARRVLTEVRNGIGWITLNNAAKRNALSAALIRDFLHALRDLRTEKIPVIVLRAPAGSRTWSAGHDVTELPKGNRDPLGYDDPLEQALRAVQSYPGVVIAMIEGGVWGGACDLVLSCDIVIGDRTSTFAITPVKIGVPYNVSGISHFLTRLGLNRAKEMFFTGRPVDAHRALTWGILNHLVETEVLETFTESFAVDTAKNSILAITAVKEQFRILDNARPVSAETFERIQGLRRRVYDSHDYKEGLAAFLEKRPPQFIGE